MEIRCFGFPRDRNTHGTTNSASVFIKTVTNFLDTLHGNQNKAVSRVLRKILQEQIDHLIIVTLTWQTQPWYA